LPNRLLSSFSVLLCEQDQTELLNQPSSAATAKFT